MNKLRSNQIFAVLLGSAAFPLLCRTEPFTIEGIFGAAIATAVQLLLCIPILLLYRTGFCLANVHAGTAFCPCALLSICCFAAELPLSSYSRPHRKFPCPFRKSFWRRH